MSIRGLQLMGVLSALGGCAVATLSGAGKSDWSALLSPVAEVAPETVATPPARPAIQTTPVQPPAKPTVRITSDEILAALHAELLATHDLPGDLLIFPVRQLPLLTFPGTVVDLDFHGSNSHQLRPTFSCAVEIRVDGLPVRRLPLAVRLEHWQDVWQTQAAVDREVAMSPSQLNVIAVDTLRVRGDVIPAALDIRAYETARPLAPRTTLTWRHLTQRPAVRQGAQVDVTAKEGLLAITLKAQALEDGAVGDYIRVRNLQSRREFRAQIIADNELEILF